MSERRRRPEPLSHLELSMLVTALCGDAPYPSWVAKLQQRADAWEKERERLKDPVGAICKELSRRVPEVTFLDRSFGDRWSLRMLLERPGRMVHESVEVVPDLCGSAINGYVRRVWIPERTLAEDFELSRNMLEHEPEALEDMLEARARRFLERTNDENRRALSDLAAER